MFITKFIEALQLVDDSGIITLTLSQDHLKNFRSMRERNSKSGEKILSSKKDKAHLILDCNFMDAGILQLPLNSMKGILNTIDLQYKEDDDVAAVSFDFFKYLNIKKNDVPKQKQELKHFHEKMQSILLKTQVKKNNKFFLYGTISFLNEREKGKTFCGILVKSRDNEPLPALKTELEEFVNQNLTIKELLSVVALRLNKIGPYAWVSIKADEFELPSFILTK